MKPRGTNNAAE
ncbi:hypothetical protein VCHENC01_4121A, partial [Vibrio harveyi]